MSRTAIIILVVVGLVVVGGGCCLVGSAAAVIGAIDENPAVAPPSDGVAGEWVTGQTSAEALRALRDGATWQTVAGAGSGELLTLNTDGSCVVTHVNVSLYESCLNGGVRQWQACQYAVTGGEVTLTLGPGQRREVLCGGEAPFPGVLPAATERRAVQTGADGTRALTGYRRVE